VQSLKPCWFGSETTARWQFVAQEDDSCQATAKMIKIPIQQLYFPEEYVASTPQPAFNHRAANSVRRLFGIQENLSPSKR
jgi:hypothetical protein